MRRLAQVGTLYAMFALNGTALHAQTSLASRVAQLRDGSAYLQFASRPGVCGDGRDMVGYNAALFSGGFESYRRWSGVRCVAGPLRVTLTVAHGQVTHVRTQVGGDWRASDGRATDLGVVDAHEASTFFFDLAARLAFGATRDRPLLAAVLADDASVTTRLVSLARDTSRDERTRRDAILWLGLIGEDQGRRALRAMIEDGRETESVRAHAAFALGQASREAPEESSYLRAVYSRVEGERLKEAIIQAAAEDDADRGRWLLQRAHDARESDRLRRSALFWAGQHEATPTADLVAFLRDEPDAALREHAVFVLSQRPDDAAVDSLLHVARDDRDARVRSRALFWLAQKHDQRVTKLISDLLDR
jgi:HEAT repeat protein